MLGIALASVQNLLALEAIVERGGVVAGEVEGLVERRVEVAGVDLEPGGDRGDEREENGLMDWWGNGVLVFYIIPLLQHSVTPISPPPCRSLTTKVTY